MTIVEIIVAILVVIGVIFNFLGVLGILRFPDVYNRLHASTKCVTLGEGGVLLGLTILGIKMYLAGASISFVIKPILIMLFLLVTGPVASHAIARAAYKSGVPLWPKSVVDQYKEYLEKEAAK
ncbi:MAG: Na+/H+ antiporter subunit G [Euryarchaeota archaeon]|nr:Na+/H+ antiporter subunit G [Euryarchaeota archaeon]